MVQRVIDCTTLMDVVFEELKLWPWKKKDDERVTQVVFPVDVELQEEVEENRGHTSPEVKEEPEVARLHLRLLLRG